MIAHAPTEQTRPRLGAKLRIEQHGPTSHSARVWLDDLELTAIGGGLMSLDLSLPINGHTVATLRIGVDELEVDAETMLALEAVMRDKHAH